MGDETGLARVEHDQIDREQQENTFITNAQLGADPEAGTQQLRLLRFSHPRSGQQVLDEAGAPADVEALSETIFFACSTTGFFAPQRLLRGDSLEQQQVKAAVLGAHLHNHTALAAGPWPPFLKDGPSSVTLAMVNDLSVGLFSIDIRTEHMRQFRAHYDTRMGVKTFQILETPSYALVLPPRACATEEFAHFASLCSADVPLGFTLNGRDVRQEKTRYAFTADFDGCHQWVADTMTKNPLPTWTNGSPMVFVGTGAKPDTLTFVVLGVEGRGGKEALHHYLYRLTGYQPTINWEAQSVARRSLVNVSLPWTHETERLCHRLTRSAASIEIDSPFHTDKVFRMQFSPDADTASFRNGKEVVRGGGGGLQIAQLQQQADDQKRQLDDMQPLLQAGVQGMAQAKADMASQCQAFQQAVLTTLTSVLSPGGVAALTPPLRAPRRYRDRVRGGPGDRLLGPSRGSRPCRLLARVARPHRRLPRLRRKAWRPNFARSTSSSFSGLRTPCTPSSSRIRRPPSCLRHPSCGLPLLSSSQGQRAPRWRHLIFRRGGMRRDQLLLPMPRRRPRAARWAGTPV